MVYLTPDEADDPCELAIIVARYDQGGRTDRKQMSVKWLWRREHLEVPPCAPIAETRWPSRIR